MTFAGETFDAVVMGGGPAGSSTAIALANRGWRVAMVEKAAFPRRKVCGEFLSATSVPVLDRLGIGAEWRADAGPEVHRLALFSGRHVVEASMPARVGFGRALGRDVLDLRLAREAVRRGVVLFQPARVVAHRRDGEVASVEIVSDAGERTLTAPVVVAAHGSWEAGKLASQLPRQHGDHDFLGFKAHFHGASLPADTMPLLAFPGGYGGIVWADGDRLSLSCCIRRDALAAIRRLRPGLSASEALHGHLVASSVGIARTIGDATLVGSWLAAGPIRPGTRTGYAGDIFRVGNLAGEAHPIIAEGISMAVQSGWLLAEALGSTPPRDADTRAAIGRRYEAVWRRQFALRIRAAGVFAALAIRPSTARAAGALIAAMPPILTLGATLSGKAKPLPAFG